MKVILMEDVAKLGAKGDVVNVKSGYAHNYLFPKDLAVEATPAQIKNLEKQMAKRDEEKAQEKAEAEATAAKLQGVKVVLKAKVGGAGKLFGTVTNKEIAEQLRADHGIDVDRRKIVLQDKIKELGTYTLPVKLHPEVKSELNVEIVQAE